jgi:hypothetical protein
MYNKVNALVYELIVFLCKFYPLKRKPWIRRILDYCRPDWAAFRAEVAMRDVDKQVEESPCAVGRGGKKTAKASVYRASA